MIIFLLDCFSMVVETCLLLLPCRGRLITSQGRRDLDQVAGRVAVEA
jgi:ribosomal protein S19E (S16A)